MLKSWKTVNQLISLFLRSAVNRSANESGNDERMFECSSPKHKRGCFFI